MFNCGLNVLSPSTMIDGEPAQQLRTILPCPFGVDTSRIAQMPVGRNTRKRLRFPHPRSHRQPRVGDEIRPITPDKDRVALARHRLNECRSLAAFLV